MLIASRVHRRLRIELALRLYEKGIASLGQARRIAGPSKWDFLEFLAREEIPIQLHQGRTERGFKDCLKVCEDVG